MEGAFFWGFQQEEQKSTSLTSANPVTNIMCLESNLYNGTIANSSHYNPFYSNIDAINYVLSPKTNAGASGAPVFFITSIIKNNKKVESTQFAGVQFGIDYDYNCTYIVNAAEVIK
ncbi:MAG: hypothetical protein JWP37_3051 [Mucilaginibacter sp.]|nr:hypothetical protein [Mucilaginibacter sp.]